MNARRTSFSRTVQHRVSYAAQAARQVNAGKHVKVNREAGRHVRPPTSLANRPLTCEKSHRASWLVKIGTHGMISHPNGLSEVVRKELRQPGYLGLHPHSFVRCTGVSLQMQQRQARATDVTWTGAARETGRGEPCPADRMFDLEMTQVTFSLFHHRSKVKQSRNDSNT